MSRQLSLIESLEETIYMVQPVSFIEKSQESIVCELHKSIYRLKQVSRSWTIRIDQLIKSFGCDLCPDKPCVYRRRSGLVVVGSWYFMWKASHSLETMIERLSQMKSMDNHLVRYEELRKSQSYP